MQVNEPAPAHESLVYTIDQVGQMLGGKGRNYVYQAIASGQLKSLKLGKSRRIAHVDLVAFINARRKESDSPAARRSGASR